MPGTGKPSNAPDFSALPEELTELHQWVLHKAKMPHKPDGTLASPTNPDDWATFYEVVAAYNEGGYDGIGFVFTTKDPYCGIDLDGCRDPETGEIGPWAQEVATKLGSYTELSFSPDISPIA